MAELSAAGHPADRPRRHHLQHRVLLGRRARRDHPARGEPAALAVARRAVRAGRRRRQPRPHAAAGARPRAAATPPARAPTTSPPSGSCAASPTAWRAGCPPPRRSSRSSATSRAAPSTSRSRPGDRLSELLRPGQLQLRAAPTVYVGADDEDELIRKYEQAVAGLPFEFEEPDWMRVVDRADGSRIASRRTASCSIPLSDGTRLAGRVWRPETSDMHPVPAILEFIPYRQRDLTAVRDSIHHPYLAGHGYAGVRVDLRGSGDSEGVLTDEYLEQELSRRRGGAGLARRAAVVQRAHRDDGHLLGRVQRPAGRRAPPAEPACRRHRLLHRRPLRRRRALHGRLPADRQPVVGVDDVRLQLLPARPGRGRRALAGDVARAAARQRALAGGVAAPPASRRLLAARLDLRGLRRRSRARCSPSAAGPTATRTRCSGCSPRSTSRAKA